MCEELEGTLYNVIVEGKNSCPQPGEGVHLFKSVYLNRPFVHRQLQLELLLAVVGAAPLPTHRYRNWPQKQLNTALKASHVKSVHKFQNRFINFGTIVQKDYERNQPMKRTIIMNPL